MSKGKKKAQVQKEAQVSPDITDRLEQFYVEGSSAFMKCSKCGDETLWILNGICMACVRDFPRKEYSVIEKDAD